MNENQNQNQKTGYKYSLKFNQSLSTGTIAFEGYCAFDSFQDYQDTKMSLVAMLKEQEHVFEERGYKVASIIPNNLRTLKDLGKDTEKEAKTANEAIKEIEKKEQDKIKGDFPQ